MCSIGLNYLFVSCGLLQILKIKHFVVIVVLILIKIGQLRLRQYKHMVTLLCYYFRVI